MAGARRLLEPLRSGSAEQPPDDGRPIDDFIGRLRPYVPPGPSSGLLQSGAFGCGLTVAAGVAVATLPSGSAVRGAAFFRVGDDSLAEVLSRVEPLALPLVVIGAVCLLVVGLLWLVDLGRQPALVFVAAQPFVGVASASVAAVVWAALLLATALNLAIAVIIMVAYVVVGLLIFAIFIAMLWEALTNP